MLVVVVGAVAELAAEPVAVVVAGVAIVDVVVVDAAEVGCVNAGVIGETAAPSIVVDGATEAKPSAVEDVVAVAAAAVVGEAVAGCNRFRIARRAELVWLVVRGSAKTLATRHNRPERFPRCW